MDCVALFLSSDEEDSSDDETVSSLQADMKHLRDCNNIMDIPSNMFIKAFRLSKEAFKYVLEKIEPKLSVRQRSTSIPNDIKLGATLRFFAQGSYQLSVGDDFLVPMSQSAFSRVLNEVSTAIEDTLCPIWIGLQMTDAEKLSTKMFFYNNYKLPNVIGVIDGTHINIIRPTNDEPYFFNRKQKHSINAMIICDEKLRIRSVDGTNGGSSHDAFNWAKSTERQFFMNMYNSGEKFVILGDSAYPLEPWLMTPYRTASDQQETKYNKLHAQARSKIENTFGLLKSRFRCLLAARELHYAPAKAVQFLNACCALHNICLEYKVPNIDEEGNDYVDSNNEIFEESGISTQTSLQDKAKAIRNRIKNSL